MYKKSISQIACLQTRCERIYCQRFFSTAVESLEGAVFGRSWTLRLERCGSVRVGAPRGLNGIHAASGGGDVQGNLGITHVLQSLGAILQNLYIFHNTFVVRLYYNQKLCVIICLWWHMPFEFLDNWKSCQAGPAKLLIHHQLWHVHY